MATRKLAWGALLAVLAGANVYQYALLTRRAAPAAPGSPSAPPDPGPGSDDRIVRRFHLLVYNRNIWQQNHYLGVQTLQNPEDVWITQEILHEVKPDFLVETGTHHGGSAALWATFLQQMNPDARVITVDIEDKVKARELPIFQQKVDFLLGSSTAPEIVDDVRRRVKGKRVMVVLDSWHGRDHVLKEMELYGPLVSPGSYMIVQDTNINGHPVLPGWGPGPWEALDAFLPSHPEFEPDRSRERLLFTMHPRGYLKRVR